MIKPNQDTTRIWVLLNLAHRQVTQRFESELRRAGLPAANWYDILWSLECAPEGLRQFELERQSLFDQPNLSRTLKRMVEEGLVKQVPAPEDRRGRVLSITEAGLGLRARMWAVYGGLMQSEIGDAVPETMTKGLIEGLTALLKEPWPKLEGGAADDLPRCGKSGCGQSSGPSAGQGGGSQGGADGD